MRTLIGNRTLRQRIVRLLRESMFAVPAVTVAKRLNANPRSVSSAISKLVFDGTVIISARTGSRNGRGYASF
jgi:Mn-dependent DtxR family transcriptional regulator